MNHECARWLTFRRAWRGGENAGAELALVRAGFWISEVGAGCQNLAIWSAVSQGMYRHQASCNHAGAGLGQAPTGHELSSCMKEV